MLVVSRSRPAAAYLVLPVFVLLAAAMTDSRDLGVRYVIFLPTPPVLRRCWVVDGQVSALRVGVREW
jgi:hypothetical protein